MNNSLSFSLFFGLVLAPAVIALQLKIFAYLVKLFKLHVKLDRPIEILSLIISELVAVIISLQSLLVNPSFYVILVSLAVSARIYGLWKMKKWVIYVFLASNFLPLINGGLFQINNIWLNLISVVSQALILLVYYLYVYKPNQNKFK